MIYAIEEVRNLAAGGARYACIEDATIFGYALHYFEEDSIASKLYNLDGSVYQSVVKTANKTTSK